MTLEDFKILTPIEQELYYQLLKQKQADFYRVMCHRCESDVEINYRLWLKIKEKLNALYGQAV